MRTSRLLAIGLIAIVAAACTSGGGSSAAPSEAAPTEVASTAPSAAPSAEACATEDLAVVTAGTLTVGTDNPAYPPYFAENPSGTATAPWEFGDPTTGEGFESAVAYAIAEQLGFTKDQVTWVVVPFANAFAPGAKTFDFDVNQISFKPERTETADLSEGYYFGNQSLVALEGSPAAAATSIAELKDFIFGAQVGTTSYDAIVNVIAPTTTPAVYDTNDAAIEALKAGTIDGIVVDLPTADFITNVQVEGAVIVGQFEGGTPEYFSAVLTKDSELTDCVNAAIAALTADGTLDELASTWLPFQETVPVIKP